MINSNFAVTSDKARGKGTSSYASFGAKENSMYSSNLELLRESFPNKMQLDVETLAEVLDVAVNSIYNKYQEGRFPIQLKPLYKGGRKLYATIRSVAQYLDEQEAVKRPVGRPRKTAANAQK